MKFSFLGKAASAAALALVLAASVHADSITQKPWGTAFGTPVKLFTLTNAKGMVVKISNYGGIIQSVVVPDRQGRKGDIALGFSDVAQYVKSSPYFGAIVGRFANRIDKGKFTLDGKTYHLFINNAPNTLHGGKRGFDKRIWDATPGHVRHGVSLSLILVSPNGQEGYPGTLRVHVVYTLRDDNSLEIDYHAVTNQDTIVNLSNHTYWNLNGQGNGTVLGQMMMINANRYTPIDKTSIPLGPEAPVAGTPFDFRTPHTIGARINKPNQQLKNAKGYDDNWVLNQPGPRSHPAKHMILAARVYSPQTGREMTVYTNQPGLQFYSGNFLDGTLQGKDGKTYLHRGAFVLETQHYPDSPNEPKYPTTELKPGQVYHYTTIERFSTR
jgi:aldose 1-epimerase